MPIKLALLPNLSKDKELSVTKKIVEKCNAIGGFSLFSKPEVSLEGVTKLSQAELYRSSDYAIVLGGDGTLLSEAGQCAIEDLPIIGINLGTLGFMTAYQPDDFIRNIERIFSVPLPVEERMRLLITVKRQGKLVFSQTALNDAVITSRPKPVYLRECVDNNTILAYNGDGLIFSSPTGSTAYSLSAGGPLVSPELEGILLTPICPHHLGARTMIVPPHAIVSAELLRAAEDSCVTLSVDGQNSFPLMQEDCITATRANEVTKLIRPNENHFYSVLSRKLPG